MSVIVIGSPSGTPSCASPVKSSVNRHSRLAPKLALDIHHDLQARLEVARRDVEVWLTRLGESAERTRIPENHLEIGDPGHEIQSWKSISSALGTIAAYSSSSSSPPPRAWAA